MPRRLALAALPLVLIVALLSACTESTRIPTAEPPSATQPLFASDEEALEAATAAYEEYLAVLDSALQQPEKLEFPFSEVAGGSALDEARDSLNSFVDDGLRITGARQLMESKFQQSTLQGDIVEIQIYVCESVANVDVLDLQGNSLVEPGRPELTAFEVTVFASAADALVHERIVWSGGGVCAG